MLINYRKTGIIITLILLILLIAINVKKYQEHHNAVAPVWSSFDEEYYEAPVKRNVLNSLIDYFDVNNLICHLTRVNIKAPITYLKQEIPLFAIYTPGDLKEPARSIYLPDEEENKIIQLKFNLNKEDNTRIVEDQTALPTEGVTATTPVVFIYHTHTSESYIDDPRQQDNNGHVRPGNIGNVGKVGIELARTLYQKHNVKVIHTTRVHDEEYCRSYFNSRQTLKETLINNPDIDLVLDIHRDSGWAREGKRDFVIINGKRAARIMILVTTKNLRFNGPDSETGHNWRLNFDFASKLSEKMETIYPGLLFRIEERDTTYNNYNQDLHSGSLLLEIGDYRNTTEEALYSARLLADVIAELLQSESP